MVPGGAYQGKEEEMGNMGTGQDAEEREVWQQEWGKWKMLKLLRFTIGVGMEKRFGEEDCSAVSECRRVQRIARRSWCYWEGLYRVYKAERLE